MERIKGDEVGLYDGIIRIIWKDKAKTIFLVANGDDDDRFISLNDCLKEIGYDKKSHKEGGVVIVIMDESLSGKAYIYGQYGNNWTEYGETRGYC